MSAVRGAAVIAPGSVVSAVRGAAVIAVRDADLTSPAGDRRAPGPRESQRDGGHHGGVRHRSPAPSLRPAPRSCRGRTARAHLSWTAWSATTRRGAALVRGLLDAGATTRCDRARRFRQLWNRCGQGSARSSRGQHGGGGHGLRDPALPSLRDHQHVTTDDRLHRGRGAGVRLRSALCDRPRRVAAPARCASPAGGGDHRAPGGGGRARAPGTLERTSSFSAALAWRLTRPGFAVALRSQSSSPSRAASAWQKRWHASASARARRGNSLRRRRRPRPGVGPAPP